MGKIIFIITMAFSSIVTANESISIKSDFGVSDKEMLTFIKKAFNRFAHDDEVAACATKLKTKKTEAIESLYAVLIFKMYQDKSSQGSALQKLEFSKKLYKISPYYMKSINYCKTQ